MCGKEIYEKIKAKIKIELPDTKKNTARRQIQALLTLEIAYGLYQLAQDLRKQGALKLDDKEGKKKISEAIVKNEKLLLTGGEFMPKSDTGSHLIPKNFIGYIEHGMKFLCEKWESGDSKIHLHIIDTLLAHDTLTYPRFVSYTRKWVPPGKSELDIALTGWLFSDTLNVFDGTQFSITDSKSISSQISARYKEVKADKKKHYNFWSSLITMIEKAFSLGWKKESIHQKLKDSRIELYKCFNGLIPKEDVDQFIDKEFEEVFMVIVMGGWEDEEDDKDE